ncbi:MAG: bifunctional proline dehydrogenase/L-glutamate gamma-semialdehyde dehydrogenase [Planctomycetales bacterium]|nr:bifunctional proline dehydrogenase/L-glutamate gamma-semialdehyde dehydrogenase [Planctomycetales bacterium]
MTNNTSPLNLVSMLAAVDAHCDNDADAAIEIAKVLLIRSRALQTPQERRQQAELDRMIRHPGDKATLVEMTDQAFRTHSSARVADQLTHILDAQGVPRFFSPLEQTMLRGFQTFGGYMPGVSVPLVKDKMRQETANVILPAEEEPLREHLAARQETGLLMNVNFLGEALLGEREAERRLRHYLHALQIPEIACVSVKLSTIFSQVSTIDRRHTIETVSDRLELLYRAAIRERFKTVDGGMMSKFVYLDMEEYRDLYLTAEVFKQTLDRQGMEHARAGIALQAYIPDSCQVLADLIQWSQHRVTSGGVPVTIRLVKGANMEMERVEASLGGWPQTPFSEKRLTDANFKKMLRMMIDAAANGLINIGVASHNLFDISLALLWGSRTALKDAVDASQANSVNLGSVLERIQFEMLEGMANHQRRALFETAPKMLLYAPACRREDFLNAIGYLIRRLDENTGPENFLRYSFSLTPESETWQKLADGFRDSLGMVETIQTTPRRTQDRRQPAAEPPAASDWESYVNESDTDWSLPHHSLWADSIVDDWKTRCDENAFHVPLKVAGEVRDPASSSADGAEHRQLKKSFDPSRPGHVACRYTQATSQDVDDAIACADQDPDHWRDCSWQTRYERFRTAAQNMRQRRSDLIGSMMIDGGKLISEADPEVSEAIDFTEFYPLTVKSYLDRLGAANSMASASSRGAVAVISPWNFPLAIPCGGIVAALAAGNTVILKPASDTVLPAYLLAKCFWDAGVPETALQLIPCSGGGAGQQLVSDPRIRAVVLTGGTETARAMLRLRPDLHLIAETGGKNATIVTALSDRDLAIKHVLHSAFSHSGQKCSATSLLLLDHELYGDDSFRNSLIDAVESLPVGPVWDLRSRIGPLIRPPSGVLDRAMKELESGEEWLVRPRRIDDNPQLYTPGVKWNVASGSFTHGTELFGPVLGVMPFSKLEQAIEMVNATGYGLTSGLESLDDREQAIWRNNIHAGNLYINRPTTGAIVLRQPFGGIGSSGYGPGAKAGGPHYVVPLMRFENVSRAPVDHHLEQELSVTTSHEAVGEVLNAIWSLDPDQRPVDVQLVSRFADDARRFANETVQRLHDHVRLIGQDNFRRYLPVRQLRVRLLGDETIGDVVLSILAAAAAGCNATYSVAPDSNRFVGFFDALTDLLIQHAWDSWRCEWIEETGDALAGEIVDGRVGRLRLLTATPQLAEAVHHACHDAFVTAIAEPVVHDAAIETLRYLNEQSISHDYHRYGNLGRRQPSV